MITGRVVDEATAWHTKHNKPVLMSEYGADTIEGLHLVRQMLNHVSLEISKFLYPSNRHSFGPRNIRRICSVVISVHLTFYEQRVSSSANLYGILLILKRINVSNG